MSNEARRQSRKAVEALNDATVELEQALNLQTDHEDDAGRWARVRALQAQAQLLILHSISYDLDAIRDAIDESS